MPSIKEKCVCQICICGKHHCGEEITFPSLIEATSGEQCKTQTTAAATAAVPGQPILKSSSTTTLLQAEVPQSYDSKKQKDGSGRQQLIEDDTQSDGDHHHQHHHHHQQTTTANSSLGGCEQSRQRVVTTITTLTRKTSQQRQRANKEEEEEEAEENAKVESRMKQQQQTQPTDGGDDEEQQKQQKRSPGDEKATGNREEADSITISKTSSQRKTWQTSPEEVEELTRSLSRLRTDPEHGGYLYEKMVEKEKSKTISSNAGNRRQTKQGGKTAAAKQHQMSTQPILISSTTTMIDQPHLVNGSGNHQQHHHQQQQQYVVKQLNNGPTTTQPAKAEPFLPPLTGFSDSDSSFGSFSCSVEGDHHLLPTSSTAAASGDHRQVQCICESLKKSKLEETENFDGNAANGGANGESGNGGNINFIDVDDNWIVTRPKRSKPRDNLRLEGPMEMETTFRSTYETTAQRMITDREEEEGSMKAASSKRSTAATSRQGSKGSCGSPSSGGLYLNTRRGRNGLPATPLLRSAKSRRRHTRNRPMTSLKAGGDGYYNTISRDAYKNFIIVNGEAKMVGGGGGGAGGGVDGGHHVKLPKVVTKTTLTTSEEKNRQKFAKSGGGKSAKISGMEATMVVAKTSDEQLEKMVMIGGEQIRKFEKKSYIAKSDGGQEVTDVERKIIRKVKCAGGGPKDANGEGHKEDDDEEDEAAGKKAADHDEQPVGTQNYTIDTISGAPRRPFHARYQDNIRELGLLDRSDEAMAAGNMADTNYRHTTRRLHETSKDFNLQMPASPGPGLRAPGRQLPKTRPEVKVKLQSEAEALKAASSRPSRMVANGSHVMARPAHKPFILPQRIHRHKNECSVNVFEGDIDFTTTNRWAYGDVREGGGGGRKSSVRVGSAQRKRTAGRRYLKSSKRRNLFRQSSDSMFSSPGQGQETGAWAAAAAKESSGAAASTSMAGHDHAEHQATITSTYQKNFDDRLYCPALDVACQSHNNNNNNNSENFKYTGEAGGHKYYLSSNYS